MHTLQTQLNGTQLFEFNKYTDNRGYFFESFQQNKYNQLLNSNIQFVQDNVSHSDKGVIRGLHYQTIQPQGKLITVLQGSVYDVAVDIRPDSSTYGQYEGYVLSQDNNLQFYIPEGFAHGFLALTDNVILQYKCTDYYNPQGEKTIIWNDSSININWNEYKEEFNINKYIISDKDLEGQLFLN